MAGLFDTANMSPQAIMALIQEMRNSGAAGLNPNSLIARGLAPEQSAMRRNALNPAPNVPAQGLGDDVAPAVREPPPMVPPAPVGVQEPAPIVPNIMEVPALGPQATGFEGVPVSQAPGAIPSDAGPPPVTDLSLPSTAPIGPPAPPPVPPPTYPQTDVDNPSSYPPPGAIGAALTGNGAAGAIPLPRPRPDPRTLAMDAGGGGGLGAPVGPTSLGGPGGPTPLGGAPGMAKKPVDAAGLAKALQGVRMPAPPKVQTVATPNAPRPTGSIKGGDLQALLMALNAGGGGSVANRVPMPLNLGR